MRDARGRLRHEGQIWQTDLTRLRRFGRAIAANTASHRVVVADTAGNVLEEIPIALPESRQALWTDWQALDLPPLPARAARPRPLKPVRQEPVSTPVSPSPIDLEATVRALHQATGAATPVADAVPDAPKGDDASAAAAPTDEDGADVLLP